MAKNLLNDADLHARREAVRGIAVPQGVGRAGRPDSSDPLG